MGCVRVLCQVVVSDWFFDVIMALTARFGGSSDL